MNRIDSITLRLCRTPLDFSYSSWHTPHSSSIIWEVRSDDHTGWGECSASRGAKVAAKLLARRLIGRRINVTDLWDVHRQMLPPMGPQGYELGSVVPFRVAREAASIALCDLAGKIADEPAADLFRPPTRESAPAKPVIHLGSPDLMASRSLAWKALGCKMLKLKLSGKLEDDTNRIEQIRAEIGSQMRIHADLNMGMASVDLFHEYATMLRRYDVAILEDPCPGNPVQWRHLQRTLGDGVDLMLDNYAFFPKLRRYLGNGGPRYVNHHPNYQGGMDYAIKISDLAGAHGVTSCIGSSGTFGISNAAFRMLGSIITGHEPVEEIGLRTYYENQAALGYAIPQDPSVLAQGEGMVIDGQINLPSTAGLGIEIDEQLLATKTLSTQRYGR